MCSRKECGGTFSTCRVSRHVENVPPHCFRTLLAAKRIAGMDRYLYSWVWGGRSSRALRGCKSAMRRKWLPLVACITLTAFLVANTYIGAAVAAVLAPARHLENPACDERCAERSCDCCKTKRGRSTSASESGHRQTHSPSCPCCPLCPGDPTSSKCPTPGGCPSCNVVKVPCLSPALAVTASAPCLDDDLAEPTSGYTSPFSHTLTRPPRA